MRASGGVSDFEQVSVEPFTAAAESKQGPMEMEVQQDHQAIVAYACKKLNRIMLPFALLFR
jgi:hypothetical protein